MTAEEARDQLPIVGVKLADGRIVDGRVMGRAMPTARVLVQNERAGYGTRYLEGEWSWETIARCVTSGRPIRE